MTGFESFSLQHVLTVVAFALVVTAVIVAARRVRDPDRRRAMEWSAAVLAFAIWFGVTLWGVLPANYDPRWSYPINICDLIALVVPIALVRRSSAWNALLYFWGLSLSTQAVLTPDLVAGPSTLAFWIFWLEHVLIVGGAAYVLIVRRYRPTWRDCGLAIALGWLWLLVVFAIDWATGYNYGYVGNLKPSQPTLIDYLGPWPLRVLIMGLLGTAAMLLLQIPWAMARTRKHTEVPAT